MHRSAGSPHQLRDFSVCAISIVVCGVRCVVLINGHWRDSMRLSSLRFIRKKNFNFIFAFLWGFKLFHAFLVPDFIHLLLSEPSPRVYIWNSRSIAPRALDMEMREVDGCGWTNISSMEITRRRDRSGSTFSKFILQS